MRPVATWLALVWTVPARMPASFGAAAVSPRKHDDLPYQNESAARKNSWLEGDRASASTSA